MLARSVVVAISSLLLVAAPGSVRSEVHVFEPVAGDSQQTTADEDLTVYSTTDIEIARPLIEDFQAANPKVRVIYDELQSLDIYDRVVHESDRGEPTADVAFSSAMDLQVKLANDGYTQAHQSPETLSMPPWAVWRNEAFGVTFEPAVIAYNKTFFEHRQVPHTRAQLLTLLKKADPLLFGKVATYDIERSGLGLLFAARDADHYKAIWDLVRGLGKNGVKLYTSTAAILDRVASGKFVLGYNLLGSYAASRAENNPEIGIVLPRDFTVVLSRIVVLPKAGRSPALGRRFVDYLLSERGQRVLAEKTRLNAILPGVKGPHTAARLRAVLGDSLRPITVGPGLLVYLDQANRRKLLRRWERALVGR